MTKVNISVEYKLESMTNLVKIVTECELGQGGSKTTVVHTYDLTLTDETLFSSVYLQTIHSKWINRLEKDISDLVNNPYEVEQTCIEASKAFRDTVSHNPLGGQESYITKKSAWSKGTIWVNSSMGTSDSEILSKESKKLPNIYQSAPYPCKCGNHFSSAPVREIIMHLNDGLKWPRGDIADWLDDLQDNHGYNFDFQPWAEEEEMI